MSAPIRQDGLARALESATRGTMQPLRDLLARGSRLPGPRMNAELADAFAQACRGLGAKADGVALALATLSADAAPGATALEFLPVCGVTALGARAVGTPSERPRVLSVLHGLADDLRFRVRDAVSGALATMGALAPDALVGEVAPWMDGYFHAAAVLSALGRGPWVEALATPEGALARLDEAFVLARDAPRAAARYPGHKALLEALVPGARALVSRFGVPAADQVVRWSKVEHPVMREVVAKIAEPRGLPGRVRGELERVSAALVASRAPARNPDHDHGPSRDRSGKRRRERR